MMRKYSSTAEMQIEAALCLNDLAGADIAGGPGNRATDLRVIEFRRKVERVREKRSRPAARSVHFPSAHLTSVGSDGVPLRP